MLEGRMPYPYDNDKLCVLKSLLKEEELATIWQCQSLTTYIGPTMPVGRVNDTELRRT